MSINWCVSYNAYLADRHLTMREIFFSHLPLLRLFCMLLFEPFWKSSTDPQEQQVVTTPTPSLNSCAISHVRDILYIKDDFHICSCLFQSYAARSEISLILSSLETLVLFTTNSPTFNWCTRIVCVVLLLRCNIKLVSYKIALKGTPKGANLPTLFGAMLSLFVSGVAFHEFPMLQHCNVQPYSGSRSVH